MENGDEREREKNSAFKFINRETKAIARDLSGSKVVLKSIELPA